MITLTETDDGFIIARWKGERIGTFDQRGSGFVSGAAIYQGAAFDADDYSLDGIPAHWLRPKLTEMCERVDVRKSAA